MKIFSQEKYSSNEFAQIEKEHLRAYLRLFKGTMFVQSLFPLLLCYVFYSLLDQLALFSWLAAILSLTALRGYLTFSWFDINDSKAKTLRFESWSLLLSLIAGCLWGATVLIMDFNNYPEESVFLNIIVFGLTAGSTGIGSYWFAYFLIYNFSVFSIYIAAYLIGLPDPYYLLAISLCLFLIFMIQIAIVFHRGNVQNIWLSIRNEKLAQNLEKKKDQAEDFAESRTRFLASASHDLRQPLQALSFFLSALEPNLNNNKSKEIFAKVESCTSGVNELLDSILDISKLDADTLTFDKQPCDIDDILQHLDQQFSHAAEQKGLQFICQSENIYVHCDAVLVQRVLSNLISNAINNTAQGQIGISLSENDGKLLIHVSDTGTGIDQAEQVKIFEEFYQLNNPERDRKKGLGLGLSIVKRLCLLMDIKLELESEKGLGSCFTISLPSCQAPELTKKVATNIGYNHLEGQKVLVIDDEMTIRESLTELLGQWQCEVRAVESEQDACEVIAQDKFRPDLIISDYRLRDHKTGVEAVNKVKQLLDNNQLPTIIISGDTEPARLQEVALSGYELLHKPVKPAQLRLLMQRELS